MLLQDACNSGSDIKRCAMCLCFRKCAERFLFIHLFYHSIGHQSYLGCIFLRVAIPVGSMFGIFTYMCFYFYGKCTGEDTSPVDPSWDRFVGFKKTKNQLISPKFHSVWVGKFPRSKPKP